MSRGNLDSGPQPSGGEAGMVGRPDWQDEPLSVVLHFALAP